MRQRLLAFLVLLTATLTACSYNSVEDLAAEVACTPPDSVRFAATILPIMQRTCTDSSFGHCHYEGSDNGDFTYYDGIINYVTFGSVQEYVIQNQYMPPAFTSGPKALSQCEIDSIARWIENGAPNN